MRLRLSSSMSDAAAPPPAAHESLGQGNPSSLQSRTRSARRLSIVDRLAARSLTGRGLDIHVHQHFGYRLHLEWSGDPNNHRSHRFMERRFHRWDQTKSFASQLCSRGIEGLCTCVYDASYQPPRDKAPRCLRGPFYASQELVIMPTHELKILEDYAIFNMCGCKITSAPTERLTW